MITAEDKLKCVRRELKMRREVYPRWVLQGKMSREQAEREIAVMSEIVGDYETSVAQLVLPL